jgi:predicted RND superfamily exporter protein
MAYTHTPPTIGASWREQFVSAFARLISTRAGAVMTATLLFIGLFATFLPQVKPRNNGYDFVVDRDPATVFFKEFQKLYEKEDFFVIAYRRDDLFTESNLLDLKRLTDTLSELEGIKDVVSLANAADMRGTDDSFDADDFLREIPSTPSALAALRARAVSNPLYQRNLISEDGNTTAIIVYMPVQPSDGSYDVDKESRKLLKSIHACLEPYRKNGIRFALAGWPVTEHTMANYMRQDVMRFFPLSLVLTIGTLWFVFRNARLLLLAFIGILLTLTATLGFAGMAKIPINNASIAVIPLVMALALSDMIHLFSHLDRRLLDESAGRPREALGRALRAILFPCLLTSLNTGIGFFSYTFNSVSAIRSFGWLAAMGMFFEFIVTFGVVAPLLVYFRPNRVYHDPVVHTEREIPKFVRWLHGGITRRPWLPLLLCVGAMGWASWSSRDLKINTNLEELFRANSPLRQDIRYVRENLAGMEPVNVVFQSTPETFNDPAVLSLLEKIENEIQADPRIHSVLSFADYLKEMNKAFHAENPSQYRLPKNKKLLAQYLLLYGRDDLDDFVTPGFGTTRFMIRAHAPSSNEARALINDLQVILDRHRIPDVKATITGSVALGVRTMEVMVDDQVNNIGQTVIVIWMVMVLVLRSWGLAFLFLLPNLFPILINFGVMGFFGIPLDTGTALIAASAFGIIVDDTVHFFISYNDLRKRGYSVGLAVQETSFEKGEATVSSFAILGIAFGVLTLSHFQPIQFFGLLNAMILIVGMVGDQIFLKSIFALYARWADRPKQKA